MVKSAAHKHAHSLEETGWLMRDETTGLYSLGSKAWLVGQRATRIQDIARTAEPAMRNARDETGLAVVLSLFNGKTLSVVSALHGTHAIEIGVRRGSELSPHASAQGQIVLAFNETLRDQVLADPIEALTPRTITDPAKLRDRLSTIVEDGYVCAPEEVLLGVNALAAPIWDHSNRLIATVALIGSIQHLTASPKPEHLDTILHLANLISRSQGGDFLPRKK